MKRKVSDETKEKLRQARLGKSLSDETKKKISEARKGKPISEEAKAKLSKAMKGRKKPPVSDETRLKMSRAHSGKKKSEETKKRLSEKLKGRKVSEETAKKMSEAHKKSDRAYMSRGFHPSAKAVVQMDSDGNTVRVYGCIQDAVDTGMFPSRLGIRRCCNGEQKMYKGFQWRYA